MQIHSYCLKLKKKAVPLHVTEALEGGGGSSYSFLTSALDGVSRQRHAPAALYPLVPIGQEAGWPPEPVWTQRLEEKSFASAGDRNSDLLSFSLARHYTAWITECL
jgi:hypothetical protein